MMRKEEGNVSLELALVAPVLMALVLGVLQFGLWYHAEHVVRTAAIEAARVAAAEDGTSAAARTRAAEVLSAGLGHAASHTAVSVSVDADTARVSVSSTLRGLLPIPGLGALSIRGTSTSYRERFRPAGGRS